MSCNIPDVDFECIESAIVFFVLSTKIKIVARMLNKLYISILLHEYNVWVKVPYRALVREHYSNDGIVIYKVIFMKIEFGTTRYVSFTLSHHIR